MNRADLSKELTRLELYLRVCDILTNNDYIILQSAANALTTAHWEQDDEGNCYCSNCHVHINANELYRNLFCYHCGAEMKN